MNILKAIRFDDPADNVWKYVFEFNGAIAEAVLYRYESFKKRTVLCISVQSGCPVGCMFCGTGKKFIRNLNQDEIVEQVVHVTNDMNIDTNECEKFQIMFMSMGEPFLNYSNVHEAINRLNMMYHNAQLLVSTIGPRNENALSLFIDDSRRINKIGLQFSIHKSSDKERNILIPYKYKLNLGELRYYGWYWWSITQRKVYLNYCVDGTNSTKDDFIRLTTIFPPNVFCITLSVICSKDETMKNAGYHNIEKIREFEQLFLNEGYDTRIFDPAGQDSIGGGCGQLFYVQNWMKEVK